MWKRGGGSRGSRGTVGVMSSIGIRGGVLGQASSSRLRSMNKVVMGVLAGCSRCCVCALVWRESLDGWEDDVPWRGLFCRNG
eukprot:2448207-Pyramimonas_sp.AAC.1